MYRCTKTFGHELGLSAAFRQWRANSHCRFLHGYALSFRVVFEAEYLDPNGWVIDFGGLKTLKEALVYTFDHKTVVAEDDPQLAWFRDGAARGVLDLMVVDRTGCESFANWAGNWISDWLVANDHFPRVKLVEVEVREHGANSATVVIT